MTHTRQYFAFVDWMKALGMLFILYGHVAGWGPLNALPPINLKQLGVTAFVFVMGFMLTREQKPGCRVLIDRLVEMYVLAFLLAVVVSGVSAASTGNLQESNYLPFFLGLNVFVDFFPANPTTWFVGTYLHILLFWLLIRRTAITGRLLLVAVAFEIVVRAVLLYQGLRFVPYMLLPNWMTVFLLGRWYGQGRRPAWEPGTGLAALLLSAAVALVVWMGVELPYVRRLPFDELRPWSPVAAAVFISIWVSAIYVCCTWLLYLVVRPFGAPAWVRFIARNTLLIFLGHMPVLQAVTALTRNSGLSPNARGALVTLVCIVGLGYASEWFHRVVDVRALRDRVHGAICRDARATA
jgi:peptidoglycan/LPS O-acetylase OafA/YrhL